MTNIAKDSHMHGMRQTYAFWAGIYDYVYRHLFANAQKRSAMLAAEAGDRILEIGLGTGLTLPYYPRHVHVTGIDISHDMLERAQKKIGMPDMPNITGLCVMDASHLAFSDTSFDAVVFPFVIALVPDYRKVLNEAYRVLKPGGRIVIANRFGAEQGVQASVEALAAPLASAIGWSCNFKVSQIQQWAAVHGNIEPVVRHDAYFGVIALKKGAS